MVAILDPNASTMLNAPGPFTRDSRNQFLVGYNALADRLADGVARTPRMPLAQRQQLAAGLRKLLSEYYDRLPRMTLSRCPYCGLALERTFDPWGLDGPWWQVGETAPHEEPPACEHFMVLQGALNLNGKPVDGGRKPSKPGPEVPFVIPAVLNLPTMTAVVSALSMEHGYTAYPIAYFAEKAPPPGALTQGWNQEHYSFTDAAGRGAWTIKTDPWDFDVKAWAQRGKVKWVDPGDPAFQLSTKPVSAFPYGNLSGRRERLTIIGNHLTTVPPPQNETVDPFE
jgi:hypothetical protein